MNNSTGAPNSSAQSGTEEAQQKPPPQQQQQQQQGEQRLYPQYQQQHPHPHQQQQQQQHAHPNSKVGRKRSLNKPERYRPKPGMINRTPSQKAHEASFQDRNESTGNLIQRDSINLDGSNLATSSSSSTSSPAAIAAAREQQKERFRIQQANQEQQRPRPRRMSLRRAGSSRNQVPVQRRPSTKPKKKVFVEREVELTAWVVVSRIFTCCIPSSLLRVCNSSKFSKAQVIQAWREKVTLCMIIALICGILAFLIFGLQPAMCPDQSKSIYSYSTLSNPPVKENHIDSVLIRGTLYPFDQIQNFLQSKSVNISQDYRGQDISSLFYDSSAPCSGYPAVNVSSAQCSVQDPYSANSFLIAKPCLNYNDLANSKVSPNGALSFHWTDLDDTTRPEFNYITIYDGKILNITRFLVSNQIFGSDVNRALAQSPRKDASLIFQRTQNRKDAIGCIAAMTEVGYLENTTMGCFASKTILLAMLICVCMVVVLKFLMALSFSWFLSYRLTEKPRTILKSKKGEDAAEVANASGKDIARSGKNATGRKNLYTVMLVTCYSEGENSIRTTMDSLANTSYSTKHKLMVVICDGIVRGHGNKSTTPDIVVNMLDIAQGSENPKACSYLAIADGEKQHNMAKVYAGHYVYKKKRIPTVVIVKCGNPLEKDASKPGNRGKRDSQLILMSFFQRVLFADRFTELDFEMFNKIHRLMNVWPDRFELCLMVDADTMVKGDSLSYMVTAMQNDHTIMGLCGETKIANKTTSWVSAIQVFEYYISHHLGKAFESVFGGVTCLPGCFCMYRIKAPKNDSWVPILANPEVIQEYNQNIVSTLHQKNLLLLGEDRYLTTLMLRTFPKRQMVFVPQAQCKTVVPDTFSVLLSQRRRWINSTIHNLLELVLVTDLCGIAFLSMQFVVLLELIGTIVLPAAILFTIAMIVVAIVNQSLAIIPLILIVTIIGLPAILIVLTTRKWIYVLYMFIYLLSMPIWNFVLPLYSFWHFDDFSWGETRKVANQKRKSGQDHGDAEGVFESGSIIMRKWEEWEKERLKAMGYRIQKRHSADRGINDLPPPASSTPDLLKTTSAGAKASLKGNNNSSSNLRNAASAAASTPSLGSTLNGSNGSLRVPGAGPQRQVANHPMPASTPNLTLSSQQQLQNQNAQLQGRPSMNRPSRPRPPPHMMPRSSLPPGSMGPNGQSFELGPMNSPNALRPSPGPNNNMGGNRPSPLSGPGMMGTGGLEARHSIHISGPGYRPMGPSRPPMMRPMMGGPPGVSQGGSMPMSRPMSYHPQSQGPPQGFSGPSRSPRPFAQQPFSGPIPYHSQTPPPPAYLVQQQQQGSGAPYPQPPPPQQQQQQQQNNNNSQAVATTSNDGAAS